MANARLIYFKSQAPLALSLANLMNLDSMPILRHDFLDGEFKLQLPETLASRVYLFCTLDHPNEKLLELLFAAKTARKMGVEHITLIAPYLAYMRQDTAFHPGEVVSQKIIGGLLASLFDAVITVDPHLHRINKLEEVIPIAHVLVISAANLLGQFVAQQRTDPLLIGPDTESYQWIEQAAKPNNLEYSVASKTRYGDFEVEIDLPKISFDGRSVVMLDDIASSGHTLARAAELALSKGAKSVDVAIAHALFNSDVMNLLKESGVENIWSADTVMHPTNVVSVLPDIARALQGFDNDLLPNDR